jgi:hypothetical protein
MACRSIGPKYSVWDNNNSWLDSTVGTPVAGTPARVHIDYNGTTNRKIFVGGALQGTDTTITQHTTLDTYTLGCEDPSRAEFYAGSLAFAYSRPEVLSADYIAAEYSNLNAPSSFYTIT